MCRTINASAARLITSSPICSRRHIRSFACWIRHRGNEMMATLQALNIKIFADGADKAGMLEMARKPYIAGFTTNPTLMRKAGVVDYRAFAREIVGAIPDRPISF